MPESLLSVVMTRYTMSRHEFIVINYEARRARSASLFFLVFQGTKASYLTVISTELDALFLVSM